MAKFGGVALLAGIAILVGWRMEGQSRQDAALREDMIAKYQLGGEQVKVYDACLDSLRDKKLKNGGAKEPFCGCFANAAARDDDGRKHAADVIKRLADVAVGNAAKFDAASASNGDMGYLSALMNGVTVLKDCAEDQRHIFASSAARDTWCASKPDRATDYRCQHR